MRIPINLASRPYENLRPFYTAAALAGILAAVLAALVVWSDWQNRRETRLLSEQNDRFERELADLDREQRELEQWLGRPEVQEIRDRSSFLNSLIARKSLSWTRMFMDLERILPDRVQVTSIQPALNSSQQVELKLTVAAATMPPLVEFLKKLESSSRFGSPVVHSQRAPSERGGDSNILVDLSTLYHPGAPGEAPPEPEPASRERESDSAAVADTALGKLTPEE